MSQNANRNEAVTGFHQGRLNMRAASTGSAAAGQTRSVPGALGLIIACLIAWALGANFAIAGSVTVDGKVGGFAEGYTEGYYVTFDIENGPTGVAGGQLFIKETEDALSVGMITPLTVNDNTYAPNLGNDASTDARADDWGTIQHTLEKLVRSDKWEVKIDNFAGGSDTLELKFDYIKELVDSQPWVAVVERFKLGMDLDKSKIDFHSSLDYNYNVLGMTGFFTDQKTSSSPAASDGYYSFDTPNEDWLPEIAYEFEIQKSAFDGTGFSLTSESFRNDIYGASIFHMSPNKQGDHKVFVDTVTVIPLPAASLLGGAGLGALGLTGWWKRRRPQEQ